MDHSSPNTYTYQRIVRYSDCDASCNYYTPQAIDYAVEAVEGWFEIVLGVSWSELVRRGECEVRFVHAGCEFRKTLTAGEMVQARVGIVAVENSKIMYRISGENDAGEICFLANLTAGFVDPIQFEPIPIPTQYRVCFENYQALCGEKGTNVQAAGRQEDDTPFVPVHLPDGRTIPFVLQRRVVYGECTGLGTIYPPRVFDYLLEAIGEWYGTFLGITWMEQNNLKRGEPFLNVSCDYLRPMVTGQVISSMVRVTRLGRSSIAYAVVGSDENGGRCFSAHLTACYSVENNGALKATPFPDELRERIMAYQTDCDRFKSNIT